MASDVEMMLDSPNKFGPQSEMSLYVYKYMCPGFGSSYCWMCSEEVPAECPVTKDPEILASRGIPCRACKLDCPCKRFPPERIKQITLWWNARVKSIKFQREEWGGEYA